MNQIEIWKHFRFLPFLLLHVYLIIKIYLRLSSFAASPTAPALIQAILISNLDYGSHPEDPSASRLSLNLLYHLH